MFFVFLLSFSLSKAVFAESPSVAPAREVFQTALKTQSSDPAKAREFWQTLVSEDGVYSDYAHYFLGKSYWTFGDKKQAVLHFERALAKSPNTQLLRDLRLLLTEHYIQAKEFRRAKEILRKMERGARASDLHPEIVFRLAQAERGIGQAGPSCKWLKKIFVSYPQFEKVSEWGPHLILNQFEGKPTNCNASREDLKKRIRNLHLAGMTEKARREIDLLKSRLLPTEKYEADRLEVSFLLLDGEANRALEVLVPYYQSHKNDISYLNLLASAAVRAGDTTTSIGIYYRIYQMNPRSRKSAQPLFQSAFLSYQFQDYDGATRKFKELRQKFPKSKYATDAHWHLAWIQYLRGDYKGAYASLKENRSMAARSRKSGVVLRDRAQYWMAMSLLKSGETEKARPLFEQLAHDKLLGYYAIAAQQRLAKMPTLSSPMKLAAAENEKKRSVAQALNSEVVVLEESDRSVVPEEATEEAVLATADPEARDSDAIESTESEPAEASDASPVVVETPDGEESEVERVTSFSNPVLVKKIERARDLAEAGFEDWARWELVEIERRTSNRDYLKLLMQEYESRGDYYRSSYIGQIFFGMQRAQHGISGIRYLWEHTYPQAYSHEVKKSSEEWGIPTELIWGIMRAESHYRKEAISPVGALGLMQVMPNTGNRIASMISQKSFTPTQLLEPPTAIRIGSRYLQRLMRKFDNNTILVAAGYNAGPHRVKKWLYHFGHLDVDEFIEHIPFLETRNYAKKVSSNMHVYSQLYSSKSDFMSVLAQPISVRFTDPVPTRETWEEI